MKILRVLGKRRLSRQLTTSLIHALLGALLFGASTMHGRQRWISVSTSHFEMYTDNSEKKAIAGLQAFEQVRYFFLRNTKNPEIFEGRVRIIAFSSEKEFKPYRMNAGNFAYYQPSHERDYIVMQDIEPDHHQAAVHEYTHLIVEHLKLNLPLWLNEGMAEVYSSLEPDGKRALVGRPLPNHAVTLNSRPWMDWNLLFAVDHNSPYYNQPDKMAIFYAQSWALSHMLALGPNYSSRFPSFIAVIASGTSTAEALQKAYGKTVQEVAADMRKYVNQSTVKGAVYDVALTQAELDPQIAELSEFNVNLALAELLSTHPQTAAEAQERLTALEKQDPNNVELEVSMGYLAWEQNKLDETRKHFKNAIDHGLKNPTLLYKYALLIQGTGVPVETTETLLAETLKLQPENFEARLFLAGIELNANQFGSALATLAPVKTIAPDRAFEFFAISANARANLKDYAAAKDYGRRAIKFARTPEQRQQMENLLAFVEEASGAGAHPARALEPPGEGVVTDEVMSARHEIVLASDVNLPRVHGQTKFFDCANGAHLLHLQVNNREMVFALPADPSDVVIKNKGNIQFSCGTLKAESLTVVYKSSEDEKTDGTVAELVY